MPTSRDLTSFSTETIPILCVGISRTSDCASDRATESNDNQCMIDVVVVCFDHLCDQITCGQQYSFSSSL